MRRTLILLVLLALVAGACGGAGDGDDAGEGDSVDDGGRAAIRGETMDDPDIVRPPTTIAPGGFDEDGDGDGDIAEPTPDQAQTLRAGSVDDNIDFGGYLQHLERIRSSGVRLREFDPTGRIVVEVIGTTGLPVAGAEVVVRADQVEVARLRTTANGTVRFHPALYGAHQAQSFDISTGGESVNAQPGVEVRLTVNAPGGGQAPIPVDILFLLDATGSMGDEIDRLKTSIDAVAARIDDLASMPDVRFGMTLYRDEGDEFVTSTYDFTSDLGAFRSALADVRATGGGDYPEALDEGLAEALTLPTWRNPSDTIQLIFLVADAPPQIDRQVPVPYTDSILDAVNRGVKIFPVASSESDDQAEAVFRQIAQATGARFVFLSYGAGGAATGGSTDITETDYEELSLDDLVVRLVAEELDALTGTMSDIPPGQEQ